MAPSSPSTFSDPVFTPYRAPATGIAWRHEVAYEGEVKRAIQVAVEMVAGHQVV
jgi:hypothetical protein